MKAVRNRVGIGRTMMRGLRAVIRATVLHPRLLRVLIVVLDRLVIPEWHRAWGIYCKAQVPGAAKTARCLGRVWIAYPERLRLGEHVRVGRGCFLFCRGGLEIGDGTILSRNITIYTANHDTSAEWIPYDDSYVDRPVRIGSGVWIGMDVRIAPGVTIGDGAIIGLGAVIAKDVPPCAVVVSASQRLVGARDEAKAINSIERRAFFAARWPDL